MCIHAPVLAQPLSVAEQLTAAVAWRPGTRVVVNKHFFMTGEPVQFSVQALAGNKPAAIEKLAFLELFDRNNKALLQTTVTLVNGKGQGTWIIPDSIASDNYLLRVYTHAQKNLGAGAFQHTLLTIINPAVPPDWDGMAQPDSLQVSFFPEGGRLVAGLTNRTAIRCSNQFGEAMNGKGYVLNNLNDTIARFATCCNGRAEFTWTPEASQRYRLVLVVEGKGTQIVMVPEPERSGYALQLTESAGGAIQVVVQSSNKTDNSKLFLVGGGVNTINLSQGSAAMRMDAKALRGGHSAILLFDEQGKQLSQRWWYNESGARLSFDVSLDKQYASNQLAAISIRSSDAHSLAPANLTVSVYRLDSLQAWSSDAAFQLASNQHKTGLSPAASDLTLLTLGTPWRGSSTGLNTGDRLYFPFFRSPELRFQIGKPAQQQGSAAVPVRVSAPGKSFRYFNAVSDSSGIARFPMAAINQGSYLLVTTASSGQEVQLVPLFATAPPHQKVPKIRLPEAWAGQLREHLVASQVNRVFRDKDSAIAARQDTLAFFGKGDKTYFLDEYTRFSTLEEVFREYVPEVNVRQRSGTFLLRMFNEPYKQYFEQDPLVLLDGIPVADMNALMQVSPLLIRKLQVVTRRFVHGMEAYDGIVSLTTYMGNHRMPAIQPLRFQNPFGQSISQSVTDDVPATTPAAKGPHLPDQRLQVYWLPHVQVGKEPFRFSFLTPDLPGTYIVVVNGLDADGRYGRVTSLFEVSR